MKPLSRIDQQDVWNHWMKIEGHKNADFRSDIRNRLPHDLSWQICEIQAEDISKLFIISSDDWKDISNDTFTVVAVSNNLNRPSLDKDTIRIQNDINSKIRFLGTNGKLDTLFVAVTDDDGLNGPFTFIEGNRRSVALDRSGLLVGCQIFVGVSAGVRQCLWTRHSYRQFS